MNETFLGFQFRSVRREDAEELRAFLASHCHSLTGYTCSCLAAWDGLFDYRWVRPGPDALLVSFVEKGERHLLQPLGRFGEFAGQVLEAGSALPYPLRIVGVERPFIERNPEFAARFDVVSERENANYIYRVEDLATLAGRAYAGKRNHIAQARREYEWTVEPFRAESVPDARRVLADIDAEEGWPVRGSLREELRALNTTLDLFPCLGLDGILIRVGERPAAFALFEMQCPETAVVHFERALRSFKGMHQIVVQETARLLAARGVPRVNREEDLGNEGLRKAKESYHPVELAESLRLTLRAPEAGADGRRD